VDIAFVAVVVDPRLRALQAVFGLGKRVEHVVLDVNQIQGRGGGLFVAGDDGGHWIADEAHALAAQRMLVLAHRQNPVGDREVVTGEHQMHAVESPCAGHVEGANAPVRNGRPEQTAVYCARRQQIVGEAGLAGDLGAPVDAAAGLSHHPASTPRNAHSAPSAGPRRTAASTASMICR
jgi:hypothetical protein